MSEAPSLSERISWALPVVAGAVLAAIAPATWSEGASAAALGVLGLTLRGTQGAMSLALGFATLASSAVARGSESVRIATLVLSAVLVAAMLVRPGRWPTALLPAVGVGGLLAALLPWGTSYLASAPLDRAPGLLRWPALVACFCAVLLFYAKERPSAPPRLLLTLALLLSGAVGLHRLLDARSTVAMARQAGTSQAGTEAEELARRAGWAGGEREARALTASALLKAGDTEGALAALPQEFALDPAARAIRAEALLAKEPARAMNELHRMADLEVALVSSDEAAARLGLWNARLGHEALALPLLEHGASAREPERYLGEASAVALRLGKTETARDLARKAILAAPRSVYALCALASADPTVDHARECLDQAPFHAPSLAALAAAGDASAKQRLAARAELRPLDNTFGGVFKVTGARIGAARVERGAGIPVEIAIEVLSNPAVGETYQWLLHVDGPRLFVADGSLPAVPSWHLGDRWLVQASIPVPPESPPGRYTLMFGFYSRETGIRLHPSGLPGHIQVVQLGDVEVAP